jgi:hypothetical protein
MTTLSVIVDWSGPFASIQDAKAAAADWDIGEVVYLATGKCRGQKISRLQYIGISSDPRSRFNKNHHRLPEITRAFGIWVGEIVSHGVAGRPSKRRPIRHSIAVDRAEWTLAYFLELPLNKRKRRKPPPQSIALFNRWYKPDFDTRRTKRGHPKWPDFIEYDEDYELASIVFFGAPPRRKRLTKESIQALAVVG